MTDMEIEDGHRVLAPGNQALATKAAAGICDPHLFAEGFGYRGFFDHDIGGPRASATGLFRRGV